MIAASPDPRQRRRPTPAGSARRLTRVDYSAVLESAALASAPGRPLLNEPNAVPLIVLSPARDPVEAINSLLRRAGQPAHCTWIPALRDLGDALTQLNPELLVHVTDSREELEGAVRVRDQLAPGVRLLQLAGRADEAAIAAAMALGARDVVTLSNSE